MSLSLRRLLVAPSVAAALAGTFTASLALAPSACTVDYDLDVPKTQVRSIAEGAPLDILFVVDNSGSMANEHETLVRSVFDERCPITDLDDVPDSFANPPPALLAELAQQCGIAQLLAAVDGSDGNGFHIGVITTDMSECDERFSSVQDPDDLHTPTPMRGCLQGSAARVEGQRRFFTNADDIEDGLREAMLNVGTYGAPRERGLDAMRAFLSEDSDRAVGCEGDLEGFLRKDAQLLVVFVVDEDDCSHDGGAYGFDDELADEPACGVQLDPFDSVAVHTAERCYQAPELLAPTSLYADFLQGLRDEGRTRDVYVGLVGGLVERGTGVSAAACRANDDGTIDTTCVATLGAPPGVCSDEEDCCTADAGNRYLEFAAQVNETSLLGSICAPDFRNALLPIFFATPGEPLGEESEPL